MTQKTAKSLQLPFLRSLQFQKRLKGWMPYHWWRRIALGVALLIGSQPARAQQVHVLIINGLAGEPQYRAAFDSIAMTLADAAKKRWNVADSSLVVLSEDAPRGTASFIRGRSTRDEIAKAFTTLSHRVSPGDVLFVFINGHGAGERASSRVGLPGPDATATDFATWLAGFARQSVVFVNAASGSGDFRDVLAARGRVIVTSTRSSFEKNETIFARPFVAGLTGGEADADKDSRVSVLEAFTYATKEVARHYETNGRLQTEHAALSDTSFARTVAFGGSRGSTDLKVIALVAERQDFESQVASLRAKKASMDSTAYTKELERLLLEIARRSQAIRAAAGRP
jgi:hypothetical protein